MYNEFTLKFSRGEFWNLWPSQLRGFDLAFIWWKAKKLRGGATSWVMEWWYDYARPYYVWMDVSTGKCKL